MADRFWLSFHRGGLCRRSHFDDLDGAVGDCLNAAVNADMTCNLINAKMETVGHTALEQGEYVFWHINGRRVRQKDTA